jgi:hypothetical protein
MRTLLFCLGCTLPLVELSNIGEGAGRGILSRMTMVDVLTLIAVLFALLEVRPRSYTPAVLYLVSLAVALLFALVQCSRGAASFDESFVPFAALGMAFCYFGIGSAAARRHELLCALFWGIAVGVFFESVIVIHDYLFSSQWFADTMEGRVRGTFRACGQLGAYGYSAAGLLLTFGRSSFERTRARRLMIVAGLLAAFFVVAATRRSGIFALVGWLLMYLILGSRNVKSRSYLFAFCAAAGLCFAVFMYQDRLSDSFFGHRVLQALKAIESGDNFTVLQAKDMLACFTEWFPFGLGVGYGFTMSSTGHELHNGHLALLVELGVLGIGAFYGMMFTPLLGKRGANLNRIGIRTLVISFIFASAIFMIHNRLHRDRAFMLFLGILTTLSVVARTRVADPAPVARGRRPLSAPSPAPPRREREVSVGRLQAETPVCAGIVTGHLPERTAPTCPFEPSGSKRP